MLYSEPPSGGWKQLLLAVVVIAVLVLVAVHYGMRARIRAKAAVTLNTLRVIDSAINSWRDEHISIPTVNGPTAAELSNFVNKAKVKSQLARGFAKDEFENYIILSEGERSPTLSPQTYEIIRDFVEVPPEYIPYAKRNLSSAEN